VGKLDFNNKLNKNVNRETELINSLSLGKYLLIYVPLLFAMFAIAQFIGGFFFNIAFDWRAILIQAFCFAIFFRIFHKLRHYYKQNWTNKYN